MFELLDIAGAYKSINNYIIVEKYYDLEKEEIFYTIYIKNNDNIPIEGEIRREEGRSGDSEIEEIGSSSCEDCGKSSEESEEAREDDEQESDEEDDEEESDDEDDEEESEEDKDNIIEYKWNENNSRDINRLLNFLKTEGGSYYDEENEILYGPDITNVSLDVSYEIASYEIGFRNKYHEYCFDTVQETDKELSVILNEIYGTITFN
jgi:hypothetical protein